MDNNKLVKIYTLSDPLSGEIRYIGMTYKSLESRLSGHIYNKKEQNHRTFWVQSLVDKGLKPIIELVEECESDIWEITEKYWISQFKFWGFRLTNSSEGGLGIKGVKYTEYTKKQMSEKKLGKKFSIAHANKLRKHLKVFQEKREKPVMGTNMQSGEIKFFKSIKSDANHCGVCREAIGNCLKGKTKNSAGFYWEFETKSLTFPATSV